MSRTVRPQRVNYCTDADLARLAAQSVTTEPERTPCDTQDTIAAALVPGDVVLGPDGWVIVMNVHPLSGLGTVCIHGIGRAAGFEREYQATVTVQPDADTQSSASCQHYIETGRYLRRA